jgi:hypothetical protein
MNVRFHAGRFDIVPNFFDDPIRRFQTVAMPMLNAV